MNEPAEKETSFDFRARYFTTGQLGPQTRQVWVVLHGYGQLSQYFIRKFNTLTSRQIYVIAPEGLSRFYLSELTDQGRKDNRVGATWMTRENRLMDIDNYIRYLDAVFHRELAEYTDTPVTMFGFSQGCATACRWAVQGNIHFDRIILWAGIFPPDMDFSAAHDAMQGKEITMVCGRQDPYLTEERLAEFDELARKLQVTPKKLFFDGRHEIAEDVLLNLL